MSRAAYADCFSGVSGDMLLGALIDAGVSLDDLRAGLSRLPLGGFELHADGVSQNGLSGTRATVRVLEDQPRRGLRDILGIIHGGSLPAAVADQAARIFQRLADVESEIHGTSVDEVHFHEVGAVDAIVDVVGAVLGLHMLSVEEVYASGLPTGTGWVGSSHGPLPVPAPATLELIRRAGAPTRRAPRAEADTGELTTPTGAAILTCLARFEEPPLTSIDVIGYGFGTRTMPWPNALRLWVGSTAATGGLLRDAVAQIETHVDDATPEQLGYAMEQILEAGALDVAFSPLQMKKNRPGVLVRVLARPEDAQRMAELVLLHTTALGARVQTIERLIAQRRERMVRTAFGEVRIKDKVLGSRVVATPEYEDCARLARSAGVTINEVFEAARAAAAAESD